MDTTNISSALNKNAQMYDAIAVTTAVPDRNQGNAPVQEDQVTLSAANPAHAHKLLNQQILASLNEVLELDGQAKIETLEANDFSPEKVAGRILSFIQAGIGLLAGEAGTDERKNELLNKAIEGVERGFAEAKEILSGLGVLEGKVAEDIEATHELIFQGVDELRAQFGQGDSVSQSLEV